MSTDPTVARRIETYLDDLARMLGGADPALRAEVLGGVREHIEVALADRPGPVTETDVDAVLTELGPPEAVAVASLEGDDGGSRSRGPHPPGAPFVIPEPRPRALDRGWVPPTVGILTIFTVGLYLLALGGMSFLLAADAGTANAGGAEQTGGFHAPSMQDFAGEGAASLLVPPVYDALWSAVALVPIVGLPWLLSLVLLTGSSLWGRRQKWVGALLLPGVVVLNLAALAIAIAMATGMATRAVVLLASWLLTAGATVLIVMRLWRSGARRSRELAEAATAAAPVFPEASAWKARGSWSDAPPAMPGGATRDRPPVLARPWVPIVAVIILALGVLLVLAPAARSFLPAPGYLPPAPVYAALSTVLFAVLLPPVWLVGAVVTAISPLWRTSEKAAVWALVPGAALLFSLASHVTRLSDTCVRQGSTCSGTGRDATLLVLVAAAALAFAGAAAVLVRIGRAGARRARHVDEARLDTWSAVADHVRSGGTSWRQQWWLPSVVGLALGGASMTAAAFPVVLAHHTFAGSRSGFGEGHLVWTGSREMVLTGMAWALPLWVGAVVVLLVSPLWGHLVTVIAALTPPVLLGVGLLSTAGTVLSTAHVDRLPLASMLLMVLAAVVVAWVWGTGTRTATTCAERAAMHRSRLEPVH